MTEALGMWQAGGLQPLKFEEGWPAEVDSDGPRDTRVHVGDYGCIAWELSQAEPHPALRISDPSKAASFDEICRTLGDPKVSDDYPLVLEGADQMLEHVLKTDSAVVNAARTARQRTLDSWTQVVIDRVLGLTDFVGKHTESLWVMSHRHTSPEDRRLFRLVGFCLATSTEGMPSAAPVLLGRYNMDVGLQPAEARVDKLFLPV
jgi:hypothetical protein